MAEECGMLPVQQMGAHWGQSTELALVLLLVQIWTVCEEPDAVATVLSLDISEAFDRVWKEQLHQILLRRGIPSSLLLLLLFFI